MAMTAGLQCFDGSGRLTFSATDYLGRVIGTLNINSVNGSYTDPRLAAGTPWAMFFSDGSGEIYVPCIVVVTGQTITWTFGSQYANQSTNPSGYIIYGIK